MLIPPVQSRGGDLGLLARQGQQIPGSQRQPELRDGGGLGDSTAGDLFDALEPLDDGLAMHVQSGRRSHPRPFTLQKDQGSQHTVDDHLGLVGVPQYREHRCVGEAGDAVRGRPCDPHRPCRFPHCSRCAAGTDQRIADTHRCLAAEPLTQRRQRRSQAMPAAHMQAPPTPCTKRAASSRTIVWAKANTRLVIPSSESPHRTWWSRNVNGRSLAIVVSQSDSFAISSAIGLLSTP